VKDSTRKSRRRRRRRRRRKRRRRRSIFYIPSLHVVPLMLLCTFTKTLPSCHMVKYWVIT
jgi:hypothetical protein